MASHSVLMFGWFHIRNGESGSGISSYLWTAQHRVDFYSLVGISAQPTDGLWLPLGARSENIVIYPGIRVVFETCIVRHGAKCLLFRVNKTDSVLLANHQ